jgi:hypothetical protein
MRAFHRYSLRSVLAIASVGALLAGCIPDSSLSSTGMPGPTSGSPHPSPAPSPSPQPGPAGQSPTISGAAVTTARVGQAYVFTPSASSPAGNSLAFSISNMPPWASFSPSTGTLSGTPKSTDAGTFANVAITVSDGSRNASLRPFTITVQPPTLGSVTVSWQAPSQRADGTPLTNLAGFRIYYGNARGTYPNKITIANPGLSTYAVENLPSGTYYFVATAYDAGGGESAYSAVASKTIL